MILNTELMELEHFVALFDESHYKVEKQWQMKLHIRFWDESEDTVATRHYSSELLGKAGATDICLGPLQKEKMIWVSSDDPNVILHFLEILQEKRRDENLTTLIGLGTCDLHTAHNVFKHGEVASGWKFEKIDVITAQDIWGITKSPCWLQEYNRINW